MDSARKHRKSHHVFEDLPKELYKLRKLQMKKFKEARERGHKAYFSKANPDKLFVNGKYISPDQPCSNSDWICISFCKLLNFFYFTVFKIFDTINKEL